METNNKYYTPELSEILLEQLNIYQNVSRTK